MAKKKAEKEETGFLCPKCGAKLKTLVAICPVCGHYIQYRRVPMGTVMGGAITPRGFFLYLPDRSFEM